MKLCDRCNFQYNDGEEELKKCAFPSCKGVIFDPETFEAEFKAELEFERRAS